MLYEVIVLLLAGLGAGIGTGLVGASGVMVIVPIMIIFLNYDPYMAIGISLVVDIFASLIVVAMYNKNNHINLKPSLFILIFAIFGAYVGSYYSSLIPVEFLSRFTGIVIFGSGVNLYFKKFNKKIIKNKTKFHWKKRLINFVFLALIGFGVGIFAGVFGAGGGLSLLLALVFFLNYRMHTAIGTSVFMMIFIALSGAIGHLVYGTIYFFPVFVLMIGSFFGSIWAVKLANKMSEENLNKLVSVLFILMGLLLMLKESFSLINLGL